MNNASTQTDTRARAKAAVTTLSIDGMSCGHCVRAVSSALGALPNVAVRSVAVGSAVIETSDPAAVSRAVAAVQEAGYSARAAAAPDVSLPTAAGSCGCAPAGAAEAGAKSSSGGCCGGGA